MSNTLQENNESVRNRIVAEWSRAASGWRHWEAHIIAFSWPVTHRMVDAMKLAPGHVVLDIGCGIGDPAIAVADRVGPDGRVTAVDPSAEMVDTARARAEGFGLSNMDFRVCAAEDVDLPAGSLDAVCGRWSFIFCTDVVAVLKKMHGLLKPGGRLALSTWTPMENSPGFKLINRALNRQVNLPPLDPTKPGMVQLSAPGQLEEALVSSGFRNIQVSPVKLSSFARDGAEYWRMMCDMGMSLRLVLEGLTDSQKAAVRDEVIAGVEQFRSADVLRIPSVAQVGSGTK